MSKGKGTTLVFGASLKPERASNRAVVLLVANEEPVIAFGRQNGTISGVAVQTELPDTETVVDTLSLYLNPMNQKSYYDYFLELAPDRIIFNPGTENPELMQLAKARGIKTEATCTLVLLSTKTY